MKCPFCEKEIPGPACEQCGHKNPEDARFCMNCGAALRHETAASNGEEDEFDLENRILCPDGTCTGIIVDGRCTECGRPYDPAQNGVEE